MRNFEVTKIKSIQEISITHRKILITPKEYEKILMYDERKILIYNNNIDKFNIIEIEEAKETKIYKNCTVIEIYGKILNI